MGTPDATGSDTKDAPPATDQSRVYAHSGSTLYKIETTTLAAVEIGMFAGVGTQSITDIAVDKNDHMVGITLDKLYTIESNSGAATLIKDLSQSAQGFTSLSFVPNPAGGDDILVSANDHGEVFKIDGTSGDATMLGAYGMVGSDEIRSSGDLIGVANLGIYATVDKGNTPGDWLAKIDPNTWVATLAPNATGYDKIFGLGFWAGKFYGFVDGGAGGTSKIIEIDPTTGVAHDLLAGDIRWYGAGVTTVAPVIQ
jgi:hypothetical protein